MAGTLLTPSLLRRLEQFQLLAQRRARSILRGERRSRARGHSVEFADYRSYVVGDDLRYLDWNLYGRLDRLFVKLYEEERELPVTVLLDASESMSFGAPPKFELARQLAAAVGYVALCGFDRVSTIAFPDHPDEVAVRGALRAVRGRRSAVGFFQQLEALGTGGAADLSAALRRCALETRQAGVAVVLSDFLDPQGYEPGLSALASRGFHVNAIQILAPDELEPSFAGDLRLVDAESGALQDVTFGRYRMAAYQRTVQAFCQRLRDCCRARGVRYFLARSDASLEQILLRQMREAEVWQ
jgi:uncharacterized protein (DUF58 family)